MILRLLMCCAGLLVSPVGACDVQADVKKGTEQFVELHKFAMIKEMQELAVQHERVNERYCARVERDLRRAKRNKPIDPVYEQAVAAIHNAIRLQVLAANPGLPENDPQVIAVINATKARVDVPALARATIDQLQAKAQASAHVLALQEKPAAERSLAENYELARAGCKYFGAVACSAGATVRDKIIKPIYRWTCATSLEYSAAACNRLKSFLPTVITAAAAA